MQPDFTDSYPDKVSSPHCPSRSPNVVDTCGLKALLLDAMQSRGGRSFTADDLFVSIRKAVLARSGQSPQYTSLRNSVRPTASLDVGDFVFRPVAAGR
ncbi:MAG TPA: hypothetical protein VGF82_28490 [Terracidiphilus sp.]